MNVIPDIIAIVSIVFYFKRANFELETRLLQYEKQTFERLLRLNEIVERISQDHEQTKYMIRMRFSQTWFIGSELRNILAPSTIENHVLEIGCFEGLSSCFLADMLLSHHRSTLDCVDPFMTIKTNDHSQFLTGDAEKNFDYNIRNNKHVKKITVHKMTSDDYFAELQPDLLYDFIYIDGCHIADFIARDMNNSWNHLAPLGRMWMDDYGGTNVEMKKFVNEHRHELDVIHSGYQLAIKKLR